MVGARWANEVVSVFSKGEEASPAGRRATAPIETAMKGGDVAVLEQLQGGWGVEWSCSSTAH